MHSRRINGRWDILPSPATGTATKETSDITSVCCTSMLHADKGKTKPCTMWVILTSLETVMWQKRNGNGDKTWQQQKPELLAEERVTAPVIYVTGHATRRRPCKVTVGKAQCTCSGSFTRKGNGTCTFLPRSSGCAKSFSSVLKALGSESPTHWLVVTIYLAYHMHMHAQTHIHACTQLPAHIPVPTMRPSFPTLELHVGVKKSSISYGHPGNS